MTAPDQIPADLREALSSFIMENSDYVVKGQADWRADALLAGPLAPVLAQITDLRRQVEEAEARIAHERHARDQWRGLAADNARAADACTRQLEEARAEAARLWVSAQDMGDDRGRTNAALAAAESREATAVARAERLEADLAALRAGGQ